MKSFNQAIIIGHVTAEPEVKPVSTKGGDVKVAKFSVATSTGGYTKKDGTQVPENTQFHRIVAWRGDAEYVEKYIHKGDAVTITGEIQYSEKESNGMKLRYTDIVADEIILCHSKGAQNDAPRNNQQPWNQPAQPAPAWNQPAPNYPEAFSQDGRAIYQTPDGQWHYKDTIMPK